MRPLFILFLFLTQLRSPAQDLSNLDAKSLMIIYDDNLDFLYSKREVLIKDFQYSKEDIKNMLTLKQNKQRFANTITDSISKKRLLIEEIKDLLLFKQNFTEKEFVKLYLEANTNDVKRYLEILDTLNLINGLEKCKKCPLARDVEFIVYKRYQNGKIDTLKCQSAKYMKINFRGDTLSKTSFDTYSCNALLKNLSLTGAYSKNIIEIEYRENKKTNKIAKPFVLYPGKSENDILAVPIIIDENN